MDNLISRLLKPSSESFKQEFYLRGRIAGLRLANKLLLDNDVDCKSLLRTYIIEAETDYAHWLNGESFDDLTKKDPE